MSENQTQFTPESQSERRIKYGLNVALASVVVVLLAGCVVWLTQKWGRRLDTTKIGLYSLKPQTLTVIKNNKSPVKIVSLYTKVKLEATATAEEREAAKFDFITPVTDLLEEYKRKGNNNHVEVIDPVEQSGKVDALIAEVTEKYGGEVKKYEGFLNEFMPPQGAKKPVASTQPQG